MAVQLSTGAKIQLLSAGSGWVDSFAESALLLFSGNAPATPDAAVPSGSILIAVAASDPDQWTAAAPTGFGITWDAPTVAGVVAFTVANAITAKAIAVGSVRWGWLVRGVAGGDAQGASLTLARVQGVASVGGGDIAMSRTNFDAIGQTSTVDTFNVFY